jgi:trigger factor
MLDPKYKQITKTKDEHKYEINVEYSKLDTYQEEAYRQLSKNIKIEGFRPGKAPREKVEPRIASDVLNMAINNMLTDAAVEVMEKEKSTPVNQPKFDVKKLDQKEGVIFEITFVNYPEVALGDVVNLKVDSIKLIEKVEDADLDKEVKNFLVSTLGAQKLKELTGKAPVAIAPEEKSTEKKEDAGSKNEHDQDHSGHDHSPGHDQSEDGKELDFELTDELIVKLEMKDAKTVEEFRKLFSKVILAQRNRDVKEKYLSTIIKKIVESSKFEIPAMFIENEITNIETDLRSRLEDVKLDIEVYLQSQNTTLEKQREEWKKVATENIKQDLVLFTFARENNLEPTDEDISREFVAYKKQRGTSLKDENESNVRNNIRAILSKRNAVADLEKRFMPKAV